MLGKLFSDPAAAVLQVTKGKKKTTSRAMTILLITSFLVALAACIASTKLGVAAVPALMLGSLPAALALIGFVVFLLVLISGLFFAWLIKIAATTLGGKGKYLDGLFVISLSTFAPAVGLLIASVFFETAAFNLYGIGTAVSVLSIVVTVVLMFATMYRSAKEIFAMDMITTYVMVSIIIIAVTVIYLLSFAGILSQMGIMLSPPTGLVG